MWSGWISDKNNQKIQGRRTAGEEESSYLDVSLKRFATVFPAAGSSNSAIEFTCEELERYSSNFVEWVDVCKGWQAE